MLRLLIPRKENRVLFFFISPFPRQDWMAPVSARFLSIVTLRTHCFLAEGEARETNCREANPRSLFFAEAPVILRQSAFMTRASFRPIVCDRGKDDFFRQCRGSGDVYSRHPHLRITGTPSLFSLSPMQLSSSLPAPLFRNVL